MVVLIFLVILGLAWPELQTTLGYKENLEFRFWSLDLCSIGSIVYKLYTELWVAEPPSAAERHLSMYIQVSISKGLSRKQ